jgi:hypothetical protein
MLGPRLKTPGSGGPAQRSNDRSSTRTARGRMTKAPWGQTRKQEVSVAAEAEAGESPSSEAPLGGSSGKRFRGPNPWVREAIGPG